MRDSPTPRRIRAFVWAETMVFMGAVVLVSVALVMNSRRVALVEFDQGLAQGDDVQAAGHAACLRRARRE